MAQSAMTVRLDAQIKSQFDSLCEQFGMSANTAINVFVNAVVRSHSIPFPIATTESIFQEPDSVRQKALRLINELQSEASKRTDEMSLDEINNEIRAARAARRI